MAEPVSGHGAACPRRLFVVPTPEALARAAAGRLCAIARDLCALSARKGGNVPVVSMALSGGRTPARAYELLASDPYRGIFPWESVRFFQVDERWVPPHDPESNQRMIRETLVSRAPVPPGAFEAIDTTLADPAEAARRYEERLRAALPRGAGGFPRFDAVILGIGRDGHTASLFPGSAALHETRAWVAAVPAQGERGMRVTLTLPVLSSSAQAIFLASGKEKAEVLPLVVTPSADPASRPPAARVAPRGPVVVLADAEAASLTGERAEKEAR